MEGWVKIHRKTMSHWIWGDSLYFKAWIWILMRANHDDTKTLIGSTLFKLDRGQFITSIRKISLATGLSNQRVRTFLSLLQEDKMINTTTTTILTQITVCNYETYQGQQHTSNTQSNKPATTEKNVKKKETKETKYMGVREEYKKWQAQSMDTQYKLFIDWMLGEDLNTCFLLDDQIDEKMFLKLRKKNDNNDVMKMVISNMENKAGLLKTYKSFYRTVNSWINLENKRSGKK